LLWLLPISFCVTYWGLDGVLGLIIAYSPLVGLAIKYRAGELEKPEATSTN
jgi:Fuc2NAc and GlcNAc transferase